MKQIILIILTVFFSCHLFSQNVNDKKIVIVSTKYHGEKCEYVAFRVDNNKIEVDNCYDFKFENFNSTKVIDLLDEPYIRKIFRKSTQELQKCEAEINETICDYVAPIYIIVTENGKETKIEWKGMRNCYPKSMKVIIEGLEKTFDKYK